MGGDFGERLRRGQRYRWTRLDMAESIHGNMHGNDELVTERSGTALEAGIRADGGYIACNLGNKDVDDTYTGDGELLY